MDWGNMSNLDPFGSAKASGFKAMYKAPLRGNPEPSVRDQVEGTPRHLCG
jgi:hypothetical protein